MAAISKKDLVSVSRDRQPGSRYCLSLTLEDHVYKYVNDISVTQRGLQTAETHRLNLKQKVSLFMCPDSNSTV